MERLGNPERSWRFRYLYEPEGASAQQFAKFVKSPSVVNDLPKLHHENFSGFKRALAWFWPNNPFTDETKVKNESKVLTSPGFLSFLGQESMIGTGLMFYHLQTIFFTIKEKLSNL